MVSLFIFLSLDKMQKDCLDADKMISYKIITFDNSALEIIMFGTVTTTFFRLLITVWF